MSDEYFSAQSETAATAGNSAPVWELSGWWRRVGAQFIDVLMIVIPVEIVFAVLDGAAGVSQNYSTIANLIILTIYFIATMTAWQGQTVGKRVTGIRVVREDGQPIDAKFVFIRQTLVMQILFGMLAIFLFYIPTLLNYLWPLWDDKHQALHDKIVKSRVVREQPSTDPGIAQTVQQQQVQQPFPVGTPPPPAAPAPSAPPPPTPSGTSTPYTPPPGFENPVPDEEK